MSNNSKRLFLCFFVTLLGFSLILFAQKYELSIAIIPLYCFFIFVFCFGIIYHFFSPQKTKTPIEEKTIVNNTDSFRKEFLANLAHELKTPLFSIQGYILTLLEGAMDNPETNKRFLTKAAKATDRMTSIIKDLDYITKFEVNRVKLDKESFYIEKLFYELFDSLEDRCKEKNIHFSLDISDNSILVYADRSKISQAITNLLMNSISYNFNNGKTTVYIKKEKGKVVIKIKDNGPGIEKEHLPRLFERFYRVEKSRDRNKGGSGIGLSIVKHILESHKQKITVDSIIGKGTIFTFSLDFSSGKGAGLYNTYGN